MEIKVVKRDGTIEAYDADKIVRVVSAAGLRPVDAAGLSDKITSWLETKKGQVTSIDIRDKVFEELEKVDKYASGLFAWYQNLKDKKYSARND